MEDLDMPKLQSPFKRAQIDNRCVLTNTPDPYVQWFFESKNLVPVEKLDGTNVSIVIKDNNIVRAWNRTQPIKLEKSDRLYAGILNSLENPMISPYIKNLEDGQYFGELIGPGIQENAMNLKQKLWIPFNSFGIKELNYVLPKDLSFEELEHWMKVGVRSILFNMLHPDNQQAIIPEGVVFHDIKTGQMAKLRSDMFQFWYDDPNHRPHKFMEEKKPVERVETPLSIEMREHAKQKPHMDFDDWTQKRNEILKRYGKI